MTIQPFEGSDVRPGLRDMEQIRQREDHERNMRARMLGVTPEQVVSAEQLANRETEKHGP